MVYYRDGGSGCGYGISPLVRGHQKAHYRVTRTYTGLEYRLLEGTTEPCAPRPKRKEQWPDERLVCGCLGVSDEGVGLWWPAAGSGARTVAVNGWDLLREVTIVFITFTIVWPHVNSRKGTQLHPSTENWIKDLLSMVLPIRKDPVPPSVSLSHQKALISLLYFCIRGQTDWKLPSQKTNQSNHIDHSSVSSVQSLSHVRLCDPMNRCTAGLPVYHQLPEFTQTHVHRVGDTIQPPHPLLSPSPPAANPSQHQGLFQWVSCSHEVAKVLEFQLQHQSFQWTPSTDL